MTSETGISSAYPFESHYVEVLGSKMHYVDEGAGEPVLFLHGNPTSSYLWRNVIAEVTPVARAIAPDLIGMGRSDKPKIGYRFFDHVRYVDAFIEALELDRPTLVLHDWGSALGFHWAHRHPDRVRGLAFMEAIVRPASWRHFPSDFRLVFRLFRTPLIGWVMIQVLNLFVRKVLPVSVVRPLGAEEMAAYKAPYPTIASRRPVRQWPCEIPIDGKPADVHEAVAAYSAWLQESETPKLLVEARPGAIMPRQLAEWVKESFPNLTTVDVGKGLHYIQEDHPRAIGRAVARWLGGL